MPEFSFVVGNPEEPEKGHKGHDSIHTANQRVNPDAEIIVQHYIPTPHPDGMYGHWRAKSSSHEHRRNGRLIAGINFTIRHDPNVAWLPRGLSADRQLRTGREFPLADHSGHTVAGLGPRDARRLEQLEVCAGFLQRSG